MKSFLVPLGIRCNAASVVNSVINQPRLPFDWTQMNVESMSKVLHLQKSNMKEFWTEYFSRIDKSNHHIQTSSWFPHDLFILETEKIASVEKYVRRTERLINVLDSDKPVVFLIFFGFPENNTLEKAELLINSIKSRIDKQHYFIVCNASYQELQNSNSFFIYETLENGMENEDENAPWDRLTQRIEKRVKKIIEELQLECVSFQVFMNRAA